MALKYVVSVDLGQQVDYTAIATIERWFKRTGERFRHRHVEVDFPYGPERYRFEMRAPVEQYYNLVRLDRVPLRTKYTKIARGIVKLLQELYEKQRQEFEQNPPAYYEVLDEAPGGFDDDITVVLVIDATGVGRGVRDLLKEELREGLTAGEPHVLFLPVNIHGGTSVNSSGGYIQAPKKDVIGAGLLCYQNETLRVGKLRYRDVLEKELANYRLKQNIKTGHTAFEPLREGEHDDLLFAVCLGLWTFERRLAKPEFVSYPGALAY